MTFDSPQNDDLRGIAQKKVMDFWNVSQINSTKREIIQAPREVEDKNSDLRNEIDSNQKSRYSPRGNERMPVSEGIG